MTLSIGAEGLKTKAAFCGSSLWASDCLGRQLPRGPPGGRDVGGGSDGLQ